MIWTGPCVVFEWKWTVEMLCRQTPTCCTHAHITYMHACICIYITRNYLNHEILYGGGTWMLLLDMTWDGIHIDQCSRCVYHLWLMLLFPLYKDKFTFLFFYYRSLSLYLKIKLLIRPLEYVPNFQKSFYLNHQPPHLLFQYDTGLYNCNPSKASSPYIFQYFM